MKRILICLTVCLLLTGCTSKETKKSYIEIDYATYQEKLQNKEDFALYIGSASCSACKRFKSTLETVITDYDLEIFYIDISKLSQEQNAELWDVSNIGGTPTIVFVSKGNIKLFPRIDGAVPESLLISKLESARYINR